MKYFLLFSIIIFLSSCNKNKVRIIQTKEINININNDEIIKKPFRFNLNGGVINYKNKDYIFYLDKENSIIKFYSISDENNFSIKLDKSFFDNEKEYNYYNLLTNNNVFYLLSYPNVIYTINKDGNIINTTNINDFSSVYKNPEFDVFRQAPILDSKGKIYSNIFFNTQTYLDYYKVEKINLEIVKLIKNDFPTIAEINLNKRKISYKMKQPVYLSNYKDLTSTAFILNNSSIYFSFNKSDTIYIYDNEQITKKVLKSKYISKFNKCNHPLDFNLSRKYSIVEPCYISLLKDEKNKFIYRVAKHRAEYLDNDLIRDVTDVDWSIIISDYDMNIIDEIKFNYDNEKYLVYSYKGGFITLKNNKHRIIFNVYKIQNK